MEPYRIKAVEPIAFLTPERRAERLRAAGYNLFRIDADQVTIDLLTDSGMTAMSAQQWAGLMLGDESYAGASSYRRFEETLRTLTGQDHIIPVHQGRAAERILFGALLAPGRVTLSNMHFDSTRANIEAAGGTARDLPCPEIADLDSDFSFKGNIDVERMEAALAAGDVAAVIMTVTNNGGGGQPVSLANLRHARSACDRHGSMLLLDAARFAENAYLIGQREPGQAGEPPQAIARKMFDLADGCWFSLKKDGMSNTGGAITLRDDRLAASCRQELVVTEGFPTYGGLAGRDLEVLAQGLREVTDPAYLSHRAQTAEWFADALASAGMPVVRPPGCHAIYLNAGRLLPQIPPDEFPGHALACELYLEAGIRTVEFGTLVFGQSGGSAAHELVRMALPRRVYTRSHLEYVVEAVGRVVKRAGSLRGYRIAGEQPPLRHFTATLEPVNGE